MQINGKAFLVTGGGSGLGAATAEMLVECGGRVVIAELNLETGEETASKLGKQARFVQVDVSDAASVQQALDTATSLFGPLYGAVNCAGVVIAEKIVGKEGPHDLAHFNKVLQINLAGTFNVMRLAAALMVNNEPGPSGERGVIVNTASVAAFDGQVGQIAYAASKGGVVSMTLPAARDLARSGIRVVAIAPGLFRTPMLAGLPAKALESLEQQVPFPSRLGQPSEYAALVRQIFENQMLNGEVIRLDGAIRMAPR